ncbi:MAG: DUF4239 domain-containing protein [Nocardioides sp.]
MLEYVVVSVVLIGVPTLVAVVAMLVVRRRAPDGGYLGSMESADGVFSAAGAGLAVLLAFVIFAVFDSYSNARSATGEEAVATQQMYSTAGFFPDKTAELRGQVVCYSRAVIHDEWPAMSHGQESPVVQSWVDKLDATIQQSKIVGNGQGAALEHWLSLSQDRQDARRTRLAEGRPFVPGFVWFVLVLITIIVVAFQCLFADPTATAFGQAVAMSAMTVTLFSALTLIWVLDRPFENRGAELHPTRMQASLAVMSNEVGFPADLPCDAVGNPA